MNLRKFLTLGVGASQAILSGARRPLGFQQLTLTGAAQKLTMPVLPTQLGMQVGYIVIQCSGAAVSDFASWRDDGVAPTAAVGMQLFSGQELDYSGEPTALQFITGAGSPVLNISYYA